MNNTNELERQKADIRAFISPDLRPYILEHYVKDGLKPLDLENDIKEAREIYKTLCEQIKGKK